MAIGKTSTQPSGTQVAGGSETQNNTDTFSKALNSSKSTRIDDKKVAFAPVVIGWLTANSGWLVPAIIAFVGAVGTALTWDKAAKALQDLFSGNPQVEGLTATQVGQLKKSIRADKRAKNAPPQVKKMLAQAGVMQTNTGDGKPASSSQKRDASGFPVSASATGGPKPDPKDNKPKKTLAQIKQDIQANQKAQNDRVNDILNGRGENAPQAKPPINNSVNLEAARAKLAEVDAKLQEVGIKLKMKETSGSNSTELQRVESEAAYKQGLLDAFTDTNLFGKKPSTSLEVKTVQQKLSEVDAVLKRKEIDLPSNHNSPQHKTAQDLELELKQKLDALDSITKGDGRWRLFDDGKTYNTYGARC